MSQLVLFAEAATRRTDPDTSRDAARAATQHAGALENVILEEFSLHDGMTDDEVCVWLGVFHAPTVKTARSRLSKRGLLVDSGVRRKSHRDRNQIVWELARD